MGSPVSPCSCAAAAAGLQHCLLPAACRAWRPATFASLRNCTVAEAASAAAGASRLALLPLLLQRHPHALAPSALDVLAAVPETVEPKQYAPLLRQVAALCQAPPLPRPADWAESAGVAKELRAAGEYALVLATEPMCEASCGWRPPTQRQLAAWVCARARQLDAATGAPGMVTGLRNACPCRDLQSGWS